MLVAESDTQGHLRPTDPDWRALDASARPLIAVIRIDGRLADWDAAPMAAEVRAVLDRAIPRGARVTGVELDYDCATARLPAYTKFLARLRPMLGHGVRLSVTALPTWMSSPQLITLLGQTDEAVLQVHAVRNPSAGLFDPQLALKWIRAFAGLNPGPFRVALPAYGARVSWSIDGAIAAVESETTLLAGGSHYRELIAQPREVARVLRALQSDPPDGLAGIAWFRLSTRDDSRTWSISTWRAVIRGKEPRAEVELVVKKSDIPGVNNLVLVNTGEFDANLPPQLVLPGSCRLADAINGYSLQRRGAGLMFERIEAGLLRSHLQQTIGWMRCSPDRGSIHVAP
ncbi:MAG TPA: DUF3142 domain-containing protein [Candidatus Binataceae bacterium]